MIQAAIFAVRVGSGLAILWLAALVFAVFIVVDMARRPGWQWQRAGSSKVLWLVLEIVFILGFLSIIVGILYLAVVRPKLVAAERQGQGQGPAGWPDAPWPGTAPGPGSWGWPGQTQTPAPPPVPAPSTGQPPATTGERPAATTDGPPPYPGAPPETVVPGTTSGPPPYPGSPSPGSASPPSAPPFGWYPDPSGAHELRYWDGVSWTEHVSDQGAQSTDPLPG